jgi:hypothetical protein
VENEQKHLQQLNISGDNDGEATPVPIPNTEVKLSSADGTWTAGSWESKSSPGKKRSNRDIASFAFCIIILNIVKDLCANNNLHN